MEGNGFPRQVSIFYLEIRGPILDDDHDVATILDFLLFISAAAQWTGLAIHISYFATRSLLPAPHSPHRRRWIIFFSLRSYRSPTCSFTETMFFVAQLPPCVSPLWSDVPRVNLRRDCVPALHGRGSLACWYFPSEFSRKKRKKKTNSVHAFLITISSLHANVSFSQSSNINSEGMQNGGNTTNRRIQSFWRIFSNGDVFSKVGESRPRKKKEGRRSIALKMKRELPFLPSSSFSLSLSSRFSYPSAKKTSPRSIFNPAAKLFNWESFRRAIYKPRSKIRRTRDAWYIVGQDSRPLVVGWGTDVAWWSPLPDGETWVGGRPPAQGETDGKRKKLCETAKPALQSWDAP